MTESTEWQQIAEIPIDTAHLALVDPISLADVVEHVGEVIDHEVSEAVTYELVTNEHGVAVALLVGTGLGDGSYPVEARFEEAAGTVRIAELRIRFLPHPLLGYEMPR